MATERFEPALGPVRQVELGAGPVDYHERGQGRAVVFMHGLVLNAAFWRKVVPGLADEHRCIVPTLPLGGHRVPLRSNADLSPPGIADLVADLLEALDLQDVVIVANNTGGALAQILVTRRAERVGSLVLTPCDAFEHFLPWQFRHLQAMARVPGAAWQTAQALRLPAFRRSPLGFGLLTKHGVDDEITESYVEELRRNPGVRRDLTKALKGVHRRHTLEAAERLPDFVQPTLVAWARDDKVFPLDDGRRLAQLIPNASS
jgi:pimeloyl-ACP methyl ester carboxylesterase